jgi:F-type H+-transporting ATPase subunit alpha
MTALPIVETKEGEISAYIPTNLISITDGQIYLDQKLFASGHRPAIDIGKSVSRIGGQAQHKRIKAEAGRMKLEYLQFLELEIFTRFGARLEKSMEIAIQRGYILREILKQEELSTVSIEFQMAWLVAFNDGLFDSVEIENIHVILDKIIHHVERSQLQLDNKREDWSNALHDWFKPFIGLNNESTS